MTQPASHSTMRERKSVHHRTGGSRDRDVPCGARAWREARGERGEKLASAVVAVRARRGLDAMRAAM
eukprot:3580144-Prymnesium_polylepis.1